jgi:hypothetical protein
MLHDPDESLFWSKTNIGNPFKNKNSLFFLAALFYGRNFGKNSVLSIVSVSGGFYLSEPYPDKSNSAIVDSYCLDLVLSGNRLFQGLIFPGLTFSRA